MSQPQPVYLSIQQFAKLSGLSETTIRRRLRDGSIRSHQPGGRKKKRLIPADALKNLPPCAAANVSAPTSSSDSADSKAKLPQTRRGRQPSWKKAPSDLNEDKHKGNKNATQKAIFTRDDSLPALSLEALSEERSLLG